MQIQDALFTLAQNEMTTDDHYTPEWVFKLLNVEFEIDVASPPNKVPWIPARRVFTQADDGLIQKWSGLVWCNPPFSNILPWVRRLNAHKNGIALLPHTKGAWRREVWQHADGIVEWETVNEIKFWRDGREKNIFPTTFLAAWGDEALKAVSNIGRVR